MDDSAAYGDYYQWGRAKDGHQSSTSGTKTPSSNIVSGNSEFIYGREDWTTADSSGKHRVKAWKDGGKNDICPAGFSVPTEADLKAETTNKTIQNINDAASSFLKIPGAGFRNHDVGFRISNDGDKAYLWVNSSTTQNGRSIRFSFAKPSALVQPFSIKGSERTHGMSVRCVREL